MIPAACFLFLFHLKSYFDLSRMEVRMKIDCLTELKCPIFFDAACVPKTQANMQL